MELIPENPGFESPRADEYRTHHASSAAWAASAAMHDSVDLLLRPFRSGQWLRFSLLCLVLGGGTPSAAFDWSLGVIPADLRLEEFAARVREYLAQHLWLVAVSLAIVFATGIFILFLRASFRMLLVGAIIRRRAALCPVWGQTRILRHSYFRWLLGTLGSAGLFVTVISLLAFPYLRASSAAGIRSVLFWILLGATLVLDILVGLAMALVVTLTDDLIVPIMYAERLTVLPAWKRLMEMASREPWTFLTYLLWRFGLSLVLGVLVMFLVFSALLTLFSGAMIAAASVVLTLHAWGMRWVWNAATLVITAGGIGILMMVVLLVLSLASMPSQVFLQNFGMRFVAARLPSLEVLLIHPNFTIPSPVAQDGQIP